MIHTERILSVAGPSKGSLTTPERKVLLGLLAKLPCQQAHALQAQILRLHSAPPRVSEASLERRQDQTNKPDWRLKTPRCYFPTCRAEAEYIVPEGSTPRSRTLSLPFCGDCLWKYLELMATAMRASDEDCEYCLTCLAVENIWDRGHDFAESAGPEHLGPHAKAVYLETESSQAVAS